MRVRGTSEAWRSSQQGVRAAAGIAAAAAAHLCFAGIGRRHSRHVCTKAAGFLVKALQLVYRFPAGQHKSRQESKGLPRTWAAACEFVRGAAGAHPHDSYQACNLRWL